MGSKTKEEKRAIVEKSLKLYGFEKCDVKVCLDNEEVRRCQQPSRST